MNADQTLQSLRSKQTQYESLARECKQAADKLEAAIQSASLLLGGPASQATEMVSAARAATENPPVNLRTDVTIAELIDVVRVHGGRTNHLAQRLNTSEKEIERLVAESNGQVFKANRGWHKVKQEPSVEPEPLSLSQS